MKIRTLRRITFRQLCSVGVLMGMVYGSAVTVAQAQADPTTIYKETFQFCTGSIGKAAAAETGWIGLKSGSSQGKISNLKVFSYGSALIGGAVNSVPQGKSQGYSFWFRPIYGLSVITAEMSFDVALLSQYPSVVEYQQRLSGIDIAGVPNKTQVAFLVDDYWYISESAAQQNRPGVWEPVQFDPSTLIYGAVPYLAGLGAEAPITYNQGLPLTGTVRAFGVFVGEVNGRVRIDNFSIKTTAPVPPSIATGVVAPTVESCPADSPDRTGDGSPQTPPDPDDGDGGIDHGVPDGPNPSDGSTNGDQPLFCNIRQQGAGVRVKIPSHSRTAFVNGGVRRGAIALRDRAIAQIYAGRVMPIGALVNVRVGDYNRSRGTVRLSLRRGRNPSAVRLSRYARAALNRYLATVGATRPLTAPLFVAAAAGGAALNINQAACAAELKGIVTKRAKAARLSVRGVFVR